MEIVVFLQDYILVLLRDGAVVAIFIALGVTVVDLSRRTIKFARAKLDDKIEEKLDFAIGIAVRAAEQVGAVDLIANGYNGKRDYAVAVVQSYLRARGLDKLADNVEEIVARIEEAVLLGLQNGLNDDEEVIVAQTRP